MKVSLFGIFFLIWETRGENKERIGSSPFTYLDKKWIYMVNDQNQTVKAYFTEPPTSRSNMDIKNNVAFMLYTRSQPSGLQIEDPSDLKESTFDPKKPTKFVTHGWLSSGDADTCSSIRTGYLQNFDVNVIVVDWKNIAGTIFYLTPMRKVPDIAKYYARFISEIIEIEGVNPRDIHLIGHSLGAQISGLVGYNLEGVKLGRVTGLDPAYPGFTENSHNNRISNESAEFVDIIHTCAGFLGLEDAVGHADFYPNGGTLPQPGCWISDLYEGCSHGRSWEFFAESLLHPDKPFYAVECEEWSEFKENKCGEERIPMGELTPPTARGKYYLRTRGGHPYSMEGTKKF